MKYIIATHGRLAAGYENTLNMFIENDNVFALSAYTDSAKVWTEELAHLSKSFDEDECIYVFTDLFSGSVTQEICKHFHGKNVQIIAGINLPLILEIILCDRPLCESELQEIIASAKEQMIHVQPMSDNQQAPPKEMIMMEYIKEEPGIVEHIVKHKDEYITALVEALASGILKRVYFSGHGSPYHVGEVLKLMMTKLLDVEVSNDCPTLFNHHLHFNANHSYKKEELLLICPAQSGRTSGPYYAAEEAQKLGIKTVCLTLAPQGKLASVCDIVIDKRTGVETSFAETKGHIASLTILMLAVIEASYKARKITASEYMRYMQGFEDVVKSMRQAITDTELWYERNRQDILRQKYMTFIGYGANYVTACEGGLKIMETTLLPCLSYELEEYMHGKNQLISEDSMVFFIAPKEKEQERMMQLFAWCNNISKHCCLICRNDNPNKHANGIASSFTDMEFLSTLEYLIPFQVLSYRIAIDLGRSTETANHNHAGEQLQTRIQELM